MSFKNFNNFKIIKKGNFQIEVFHTGYNSLSNAKIGAMLTKTTEESCIDVVVKDVDNNIVYRANANADGICQSYLDKKSGSKI